MNCKNTTDDFIISKNTYESFKNFKDIVDLNEESYQNHVLNKLTNKISKNVRKDILNSTTDQQLLDIIKNENLIDIKLGNNKTIKELRDEIGNIISQKSPSGKDMIDWEDYDLVSQTYTNMRNPVGVKKILEFFYDEKNDISDKSLLDAGCGTGNYLIKMYPHFDYIHAGDFNKSMLEKAQLNLQKYLGNNEITGVDFSEINICNLERLSNDTFDYIINCQVIHHLPKNLKKENGIDRFISVQNAFKEFYRILKPGGKIVINFTSHTQQMDGVWWGELISEAVRRWQENAPDIKDLEYAALKAGFKQENISFEPIIGLKESLYEDSLYLNPKNFININNFKLSDSTFSLATQQELDKGVETVKNMLEKDELDNWFNEREILRKKIGQTTNLYLIKSE